MCVCQNIMLISCMITISDTFCYIHLGKQQIYYIIKISATSSSYYFNIAY